MLRTIRNFFIAMLLLYSTIFSSGNANASLNNPNTDWFMNAKYGYFFHYLAGYNDITGSNITQWNNSVDSFDVNAFANNMEAAGAGYVVLTLGQNSGFYNSPNSTYETLAGYTVGAKTSTRDLPLDLYNALNAKGIKLMLYLPSNAPGNDSIAANNMGLTTKTSGDWNVNSTFGDKWAQVIQTWADRYGDKIAGWWFDGYYSWNGFDSTYAQKYSNAVKHGNPNAIVSFNPGVSMQKNPLAGDYEDYISGEQTSFGVVPTSRLLSGLQWHMLSHLGSGWAGANKSFSDTYMVNYINSVNQNQGVVTMDAAIFRNGSLSPDQLNQMKTIKAGVRDGINPSPPDANNVAYGIVPTASANFKNSALITDGDKDTNQFSDSSPNNGLQWLKIDLRNSFNVNRVKLWHYFGDTRQYHDVIVQLSNTEDFSSGVTTVFNNDTNNSAGQGAGVNGEYLETSAGKEISFPTVNARYVRLWSNGSSANGSNHYVEVEIYKEDPINGSLLMPTGVTAASIKDHEVSLTWQAPSSSGISVAGYNIYRNGTFLAKTLTSTYIDQGLNEQTQYTYEISSINDTGTLESAKASISVTTAADTNPPIIQKTGALSGSTVQVEFSESLDKGSAETISNYAINNGVTIISAILQADNKKVTLTVSPLQVDQTYELTVNGVKDTSLAQNPIASESKKSFLYGPLRAYSLDETSGTAVIDSVNKNNGTIKGNILRVPGLFGNAIQLDGSGFLDIGNNVVNSLEQFSAEAWIKPDSLNNPNAQVIIAQQQTDITTNQWSLYLKNGKLLFSISDGTSAASLLLGNEATAVVKERQWNHVAITRNQDTYYLYLNGKQIATKTSIATISQANNPNNMYIGADLSLAGSGPDHLFKGAVDEIRFYNAVLSDTSIQQHASILNNNQIPVDPNNAYLYDYYKMDETRGTTVADSVGRTTGTINGTASWTTGKVGGAIQLDGSTNDLNLGAGNIGHSGQFTLEAWIKTTTTSTSSQTIFAQQQSGSAPNSFWWYLNGNSVWINYINEQGTLINFKGGTITANNWYHVALTRNDKTIKLYLNGQKVAEQSSSIFLDQPNNPYPMRIGGNSNGSSILHRFNGLIDEFRIYYTALDGEAISNHYSAELAAFQVNADNGTVAVKLNSIPAITPMLADFSASLQINGGAKQDLPINDFQYDSSSRTAIMHFTPLLETNIVQNATVEVVYQGQVGTNQFVMPIKIDTVTPQATLTNQQQVIAGNSLDLTMGLRNVTQSEFHLINAQDLTLTYDAAEMQLGTVTSLVYGLQVIEQQETIPGHVQIILASINPDGFVAQGDLLKFSFTAKAVTQATTSSFGVSSFTIANGLGNEMQINGASSSTQIIVPTVPVDKTALNALMTSAQAKYDAAVEGNKDGQYVTGSKEILQSAIHTASVAANDPYATQVQVNNAKDALAAAVQAFEDSKIIADVNGNGTVSIGDLAIVSASYGKQPGQIGWNAKADVNKDGKVDVLDLAIVAKAILH